jgi:hypothetical protein
MNTFKNVLIVSLTVLIVLFWLSPEEDEDPDSVMVEYQCSLLDTYENVPDEVKEECYNRKEQPKRTDV